MVDGLPVRGSPGGSSTQQENVRVVACALQGDRIPEVPYPRLYDPLGSPPCRYFNGRSCRGMVPPADGRLAVHVEAPHGLWAVVYGVVLHPGHPGVPVDVPAVDGPLPPRAFMPDPHPRVPRFDAPHPWRARVHDPGVIHPHIIEHAFDLR